MSGNGIVMSVRGEAVNMDDLVLRSKMVPGQAAASEEVSVQRPKKSRAINIRGNRPDRGEIQMPQQVQAVVEQKTASSSKKPQKSMAELTGIKVTSPKHMTGDDIPEGMTAAEYAEKVALEQVTGEMSQMKVPAGEPADDLNTEADPKPTRRRKSTQK